MEIVEKKKLFKGKLADFWFDADGILHAVSKPEIMRNIEALKDDLELIKSFSNNKRVGLILDNSLTKAYDIKMIRFTIKEYPKLFKAVAFIPNSPIGKMISTILTTLNPGDVMPIATFENERDAKKWILDRE
ncbi:MAG: hypothetical protein V4565_09720 [Bacteroidota bacterium]